MEEGAARTVVQSAKRNDKIVLGCEADNINFGVHIESALLGLYDLMSVDCHRGDSLAGGAHLPVFSSH